MSGKTEKFWKFNLFCAVFTKAAYLGNGDTKLDLNSKCNDLNEATIDEQNDFYF